MDQTTTERDSPCRLQIDDLLRRMLASGPVIRAEVVDAARARLADGEHPSARELAITLIEEMT
jgi:hypothetical protein